MSERAVLAILKTILLVPWVAEWLSGLLSGKDTRPDFTRRVRDILPAQSKSREAAERLR